MDLFWIKSIALVTMVFDHLGVFFFPGDIYFRLIGRISFPLFSWAIANGSVYTKDIKKYLLRIFILAIISQIPYQMLFNISGQSVPGLNILFTLFMGLLGIALFQRYKNIYLRILAIFIVSVVSVLIKADYGAFGVLSVFVFYIYYKNLYRMLVSYAFLLLIFFLMPLFINKIVPGVFSVSYMNVIELLSVFSLIIIAAYNRRMGLRMKYFFYAFYPLHLFILLLFKIYG